LFFIGIHCNYYGSKGSMIDALESNVCGPKRTVKPFQSSWQGIARQRAATERTWLADYR